MADGAHQEKPISLFYSYSHRDEELRKKLEDHLAALRWSGMIAEWHDRNIEVGDEWAKEIDRNLSSADIILLLVSSSFIASAYCWSIEMKKALERHDKGEAKVIPVILRPCSWRITPFAKLQAAPTDAKPVTSWSDQDEALYDVAGKIERAVTDLQQQRRAAEEAEERQRKEAQRKADEERTINLRVQVFSLPKAGNQLEEYEDAWGYAEEVKRLAIADGASDSINSGLWARTLVHAFLCQPPLLDSESIFHWLTSPAQVWNEWSRGKNLRWFAENKTKRGATSTLLGVIFAWPNPIHKGEASAVIYWQAMAVGDTCLFQIRGDKMIVCFPVTRAADFGTTPSLLSTQLEYNHRSVKNLQHYKGNCQLGDQFVLATDALAEWFLKQVEVGAQPWNDLVGLSSQGFSELVDRLRQGRAIRDDDVTLVLGWVEAQEERNE